ncbi:MAG: hypothetical protein ACREA2_10855 [Blastocatellia bacterium]
MNITQIKQAAEVAKSRTTDKRWLAAINKAVAGVESGWWIVTELANCLAITTESGQTYFANGVCQCEAYRRSQACKHRALYRLYQIANEETTTPVVSTRATLIADIRARWLHSECSLADELMARFRVNQLEMLADDMLSGVLAAIA